MYIYTINVCMLCVYMLYISGPSRKICTCPSSILTSTRMVSALRNEVYLCIYIYLYIHIHRYTRINIDTHTHTKQDMQTKKHSRK